jgi:steroid delta-isomerase-like uncharacterized protein
VADRVPAQAAPIYAARSNGDDIAREDGVTPEQMARLFETHREAESRRDYDAIIDTFTEDCYLETMALGSRSEGRAAARMAYVAYFTAFPDLKPYDDGMAFGDDVLVTWGHLQGTSGGDWLGIPPSGGTFRVPFTNVTTFASRRMAGESIYFDLASLCDQANLPLAQIRAAAKSRTTARPNS